MNKDKAINKKRPAAMKTGKVRIQEPDWHWSYNVMILGWFIGIVVLFSLGDSLFLNMYDYLRLTVLFCLIGLLIPWKYYKQLLGIEGLEIVFFNLFATGPLLLSLFITLNYIPVERPTVNSYQVVDYEKLGANFFASQSAYRFHLADSALERFPSFRTYVQGQDSCVSFVSNRIEYTHVKGLFGIKRLQKRVCK